HTFPKSYLEAYRIAVADEKRGDKLKQAIASVEKAGYTIGGDQSKRVPAGYKADHPNADLLRYTCLYGQSPKILEAEIRSPKLVEIAFEHCRKLYPLHEWLVSVA